MWWHAREISSYRSILPAKLLPTVFRNMCATAKMIAWQKGVSSTAGFRPPRISSLAQPKSEFSIIILNSDYHSFCKTRTMTPKNYQTINICWMLIHPQELRKTQVPPSDPQSCHQAAPWGSGRSYNGGRMGKSCCLGCCLQLACCTLA